MNLIYTYFFLIAFGSSLFLTDQFRSLAQRLNFLDHPSVKRKIHKKPIPLMGGCSIAVTVFGLIWLHLFVLSQWGEQISLIPAALSQHISGALEQWKKLFVITLGGIAIALVGLYDDRYSLSPKKKLLFQVIIALVVSSLGIRLSLFVDSTVFQILVSAFWIILLVNAFNLLDNMDGLSAGVGLIASLLFAIVAIKTDQYFLGVILSLLCGSLAGFLIWNFNPAKIFMGDCGSQLIGYLIAVFTILETFYTPESKTFSPILMPLFILAVPLYDTASVIVIRLKNRESIFKADTRHFSHRIKALGMSTKGTVLFLYLVTLTLGLGAPLLPFISIKGGIYLFFQALCALSVIAILEYYGGKKLSKK